MHYPRMMFNPFALYPNETNHEQVRLLGERALENAKHVTPENRAVYLENRKNINDWLNYAVFSPTLRTMTPIQPRQLAINTNVPFAMFRAMVRVDGVPQDVRCIRLEGTRVLIKRRKMMDTILGSVDEYVEGRVEPNGAIVVDYPYDKRFAVKNFLDKKKAPTKENMVKELTIQSRLTATGSPFIVPLHHYLRGDDRNMAVMPFFAKGDAFDAINSLSSSDTLKRIALSMFRATLLVHTTGFAHLDISPENFLLQDDGESVALIDFGVAVELDEDWTFPYSAFVGKRRYAPPEIMTGFEGTRIDGRKVDVWCLGVTLFVMIVKNFPWEAALPSERSFVKVRSCIGKYLKHCIRNDDLVVDLLEGMLQIDPVNRPRVDELLLHPWFTLST